jgi:tRNA A37 threonylcarbamoyladenosine dehydratase
MAELHRFARTEVLIGEEGLAKLANSSVAVFGLGGVGSHAAEALCRAGVGRLTLVDFDTICVSNINRQLHALESTVGRPKAQVMAERLRQINPAADILPLQDFYGAETSAFLLDPGYDYVVDAIDHITGKLHLIRSCRERGIPIIASMGAAAKTDPTRIRVADISETHKCRMARIVRKLLKQQGITQGVKVVFSTEEYREGSIRLHEHPPADLAVGPAGWQRRGILGSISYIPPLFGYTMAGVVVSDLLAEGC